MGLRERIERAVSEKLMQWLVQKAEVEVLLSGAVLKLQLRHLILDVENLNRMAMAGSPVLLHAVNVEEVEVRLAPIGAPVLTLLVHGMHIVLHPRPAEDSWWETKRQIAKEQEQIPAPSAPDSQGGIAQSAAEKAGRGGSSNNFFAKVLASFALSSIRLELQNCSVKLLSFSPKWGTHCCSLSLKNLILEEGDSDGAGGSGGLLGTAVKAVLDSWKQNGGTVTKRWAIQGLGLQLESSGQGQDLAQSAERTDGPNEFSARSDPSDESGSADKESQRSVQAKEKEPLPSKLVLADKRDQMVLFEVASVAIKFQGMIFEGVAVDVPEVVVGLDTREVDALLLLLAQLQGTTNRPESTVAVGLSGRCTEDIQEQEKCKYKRQETQNASDDAAWSDSLFGAFHTSATELRASTSASSGAVSKVDSVRVPAQGLFGILAWRLWIRTCIQVASYSEHKVIHGLKSVIAAPRLIKEAWKLLMDTAYAASTSSRNKADLSELVDGADIQTGAAQELGSEINDLRTEDAFGRHTPRWVSTYLVHISRVSFTLACAADVGVIPDKLYASTPLLDEEVAPLFQPALHMILDRVSLDYGKDQTIGVSLVCGSLQLQLLSVLPVQELRQAVNHEIVYHGRWPARAVDIVYLIRSYPCAERLTADKRLRLLPDITEVPKAVATFEKHWKWQDHEARVWRSWEWQIPDGLDFAHVNSAGTGTPLLTSMGTTHDGQSRPFLIVELTSAQEVTGRGGAFGSLISCALGMGQVDCFVGCSFSDRIVSLFGQLSTVGVRTCSGDTPVSVSSSVLKSDVSLDAMWTRWAGYCRRVIVAAVPKMPVELSVVVESPKITFAIEPLGNDHHQSSLAGEKSADGEAESHWPSRSSVVVDLGCFQVAMWPAVLKSKVSEGEPGSSNDDDQSTRWWSASVERKFWLKTPPSPHLPVELAGAEHEQIGNNLYFAVEDSMVLLQMEAQNHAKVPLVGPLTFVTESSFCRDEFCIPMEPIKSVSVAVNARLAAVTVHLYLDELAAVFEILGCYKKVIMEAPVPLRRSMDGGGTQPASRVSQSMNISDSEDVSSTDGKSIGTASEMEMTGGTSRKLLDTLFVVCLNFQLESFQVAVGEKRETDSTCSHEEHTSGRQNAAICKQGPTLRPDLGKVAGTDTRGSATSSSKTLGSGKGKGAYLVTQVSSLQLFMGDGWEASLSFVIAGAQLCVVTGRRGRTKGRQGTIQQNPSDHNRSASTVRVSEMFADSTTVTLFSIDHCSLKVCGPKVMVEGTSSEEGALFGSELLGTNADTDTMNPKHYQSGSLTTTADENLLLQSKRLPRAPLMSHASTGDLSALIDAEPVTPSLGRSTSVGNLSSLRQEQDLLNFSKEESEGGLRRTNKHWLNATADVGRVLVTDGQLEALVTKVMLLASGGDVFHMNLSVDKDFKTITFDVEGGLVVVQTAALRTLVEFLGLHVKLLAEVAASPPIDQQSRVGSQWPSVKEEGLPNPLLRSTQRSVSLPPWALTKRSKKIRRLSSAPRRLQASASSMASRPLASAFESIIASKIGGLSLVLAHRSSSAAEGMLLEMDGNLNCEINGKVSRASVGLTRCSVLGLQARGSGDMQSSHRKPNRTPRFGRNFSAAPAGDHSGPSEQFGAHSSVVPEEEPTSDLAVESQDVAEVEIAVNSTSIKTDGSWAPVIDLNAYMMERLSITCEVERGPSEDMLRAWKWSNAWQGQCSVAGLDLAITTSEVQLLHAIVAPLLGLSGPSEARTWEYSRTNQAREIEAGAPCSPCDIPDGAIIAIKDVREHLYLAVEESTSIQGQFHLVAVLHYTLVGDRALFKVKHQSNHSTGNTVWFSLLSLHAKNSSGEPFRVNYHPGSGLAEIATINDKSWELWKCVPSKSSADEGSEELEIHTSKHMIHLVNQKSKSGLALIDGVPVLVKQPGNPFKVKVLAQPDKMRGSPPHESSSVRSSTSKGAGRLQVDEEQAVMATSVPHVKCSIQNVTVTLLHEAAGGIYLQPLLRLRMQEMGALVQVGSRKTRFMSGCNISLDYFEAQSSRWVAIINPVETDLIFRARTINGGGSASMSGKTPTAVFSRLKKVDVVFSEPSLDTCLFLIGALELAGPYTLRHSPVLSNRCQVENRTGVDLVCHFDYGNGMQDGLVQSWETDAFLIRHTASRRDLKSAEMASSVDVYLQKEGHGASSAVHLSLVDPGVRAVRTRLEFGEGQRSSAPGPIVVVDVTKQSQGGIHLTVSSMVRILNASGLPLELQCRRPNQGGGEGAVVLLEDGDVIDDCMGSFDALHLEGELRKALTSFNVGNYLLSIRPARSSSTSMGVTAQDDTTTQSSHEWSEDVKGAKAVHVSGLLENLQYSLKKKLNNRGLESSFGTVFCPLNTQRKEKAGFSGEQRGLHFLIWTTTRQVAVSMPPSEKQQQQRKPVTAWQEQQELMLLPTIRIHNLLTSNISAKLFASPAGRGRVSSGAFPESEHEATVERGGKASMYVDLSNLSLVIRNIEFGLTSKPVSIGGRGKNYTHSSSKSKDSDLRELELEVDFGDGIHFAVSKICRGDDGVLEVFGAHSGYLNNLNQAVIMVVVYTKYALHNDSHVPLLFCAPKQKSSYLWRIGQSKNIDSEWPSSEAVPTLQPGSRTSWFNRSSKILIKQVQPEAQAAALDLESLSGSMEISLTIGKAEKVDERIQLGVKLQLPSVGDTNPTRVVHLVPRYVVVNKSTEAMFVCQDGFQDDARAVMGLDPGEQVALHTQVVPYQENEEGINSNHTGAAQEAGQSPSPDLLPLIRFRPQESGWDWSGPVCAASLGSFCVKMRRQGQGGYNKQILESAVAKHGKEKLWFAVAEVQEDDPSLIVSFRRQPADAIPYRIENGLPSGSILYHQKGISQSEVLEAGASVSYAWDDLGMPHKLVVTVAGKQLSHDINLDKLRPWKLFRAVRHSKGFSLHLPFQEGMEVDDEDDSEELNDTEFLNEGYEVCADGPTRVLRVCNDNDSNQESRWQSNIKRPRSEMEIRIPVLYLNIVEPGKQRTDSSSEERELAESIGQKGVFYTPIIIGRITSLVMEGLVTAECTLCQLKVQRLDVDVKWQGAPLAHMLRVQGQDRFSQSGQTVLHMAAVVAHRGTNPIQLHYASLLLQTVDLNIDEDTLMKLSPFYRSSLAESTGPSRLIYYERFEIHPIKIVASFIPGNPQADYTSAQETLRALLHSVIKIPTVRGTTVELNGVLLSNALLTYRQLAMKCAQHYSWYAMRAIYIARGSSLLPPAFASLFDDSAASSLDVFFDPSNGSIDMQGLTLGMFNMLSKGLRRKGKGGTSRYLGDLEHTMRTAGSNILFAVVTEVSDSVLKGAETSGLDGLVSGFRRGILNVAMRPAVLRSAVVQGGSTRCIKLDRSIGMDEVYIEGYLQAMLDALFKQDYLRVKVSDDQVLLKNLPPNSTLMEEIISAVKSFLIGEGLLAGESSVAAVHSLRRLQRENERRLGPAFVALCEQLLVVIVVRGLRKQAIRVLHLPRSDSGKSLEESEANKETEPTPEKQQEGAKPRVRRAVINFLISSGVAYLDGRLCRHIPNTLIRRIVSGFLLSFVE